MSDHLLIYLIVILNVLSQAMLIYRLKISRKFKWRFYGLTVAVPVVVMVTMRLLIAQGMIHGHLAEQTNVEKYITKGTSMLLIGGPWLVTFFALIYLNRQRALQISSEN